MLGRPAKYTFKIYRVPKVFPHAYLYKDNFGKDFFWIPPTFFCNLENWIWGFFLLILKVLWLK